MSHEKGSASQFWLPRPHSPGLWQSFSSMTPPPKNKHYAKNLKTFSQASFNFQNEFFHGLTGVADPPQPSILHSGCTFFVVELFIRELALKGDAHVYAGTGLDLASRILLVSAIGDWFHDSMKTTNVQMLIFHLLPSTEIYSSGRACQNWGRSSKDPKASKGCISIISIISISLFLSLFSLPPSQSLPLSEKIRRSNSSLNSPVCFWVFETGQFVCVQPCCSTGDHIWDLHLKTLAENVGCCNIVGIRFDSLWLALPRACGSVQGARCCLAPPVTSDLHRSSAGHFENLWSPESSILTRRWFTVNYPVWTHTHLYCWCVENGIPKSPRN